MAEHHKAYHEICVWFVCPVFWIVKDWYTDSSSNFFRWRSIGKILLSVPFVSISSSDSSQRRHLQYKGSNNKEITSVDIHAFQIPEHLQQCIYTLTLSSTSEQWATFAWHNIQDAHPYTRCVKGSHTHSFIQPPHHRHWIHANRSASSVHESRCA
jgi:hypothetical protein